MEPAIATFLFTDIEGSSARWERSREAMAAALRRHDELMNAAITGARGHVFKTVGDAFCAAFASVPDAINAAREGQRALANQDWSDVGGLEVRMAIHAGFADARDGDYFGPALNRIARLLGIGHGGQVLLSGAAADLASGQLPAGVQLSHLGQHRLRDLEGIERVYQLHAPDLRETFPALRSLEEFPNNLPIQLTSFVGRERDLARLHQAIETARLLTLVGTGGVGKSRLALQLSAALLNRFTDGVWLVDFSLVRESDAVAAEAAVILAVRPDSAQTVTKSITAEIGNKRTLLVFDGCEQVLGATADLADALLRACPNTTVVVTSRQALGISGEVAYNVETLELDAAIALFVERAVAASSRFSPTAQNAPTLAEICRRLDGIPLALELAAPKTAVLSPKQLLEKLDERFRLLTQTGSNRLPRQQTLRALIDWSFDLLGDHERTLFRRISVFAGGCTLQAAAAVCGDEPVDDWHIFELLSSLVSKSLVVMEPHGDGQRYRMLNSIRDYAREQLATAGQTAEIAGKHARYYAALTRELRPLVEALQDVQWQQTVAPEVDNLRAVLDGAFSGDRDAAAGLNVLADLEWPELITTPQEAIRWFDAAREFIQTDGDPISKARILRHSARLEWLTGRSNPHIEQTAIAAIAAARASGDPNEVAQGLSNLASCYRDADRFEEAESLYAQALEAPQALSAIARNAVLRNWAICNLQHGDLEVARRRFTEVARLERPGSEAHASALLNLGELEFAVGSFEAASSAATQAKEVFEQLHAAPLALVVCNLAAYALARDRLDEARAHLRQALDLLKHSGARWMITALEHHALLAGLVGDSERAAALMGYADAHYVAHGKTRQHTERHGYQRLHALLAAAFDAQELDRRLKAGALLTDEQALAHAAAISQDSDSQPQLQAE